MELFAEQTPPQQLHGANQLILADSPRAGGSVRDRFVEWPAISGSIAIAAPARGALKSKASQRVASTPRIPRLAFSHRRRAFFFRVVSGTGGVSSGARDPGAGASGGR